MITGVKVDCYCAAYLHNFQKNVNSFIFSFLPHERCEFGLTKCKYTWK